jgi:hypothetical protein
MKAGAGSLVMAIVGALVCFGVVGGAIFYRMADVGRVGLRGGPVMMAAGMGGLFGGGAVGLLVLVGLLRWGRGR